MLLLMLLSWLKMMMTMMCAAIVNVIGMSKMTPPIKDLLPRLTPILKNRHEKVQENCIDLVGRIADRGAEFVSSREWMRICFELLEMLKVGVGVYFVRVLVCVWFCLVFAFRCLLDSDLCAPVVSHTCELSHFFIHSPSLSLSLTPQAPKKGIRRAAVNTFGYIAKAIGPQDVLVTLLNNLRVQERVNRVCTTVAIAIVAETCSPFTVLPALMNEYRVPELNVQNGTVLFFVFLNHCSFRSHAVRMFGCMNACPLCLVFRSCDMHDFFFRVSLSSATQVC